MIAFVSGKRITLDTPSRTVTVQGRFHHDRSRFEEAQRRVAFYQGLNAKHVEKPFYAASLAAAQRAADMVAQAEVASHE